MRFRTLGILSAAVSGVLAVGPLAHADFVTGVASNYGIIAGPNTTSFQFSNSTYNANIGIDNSSTTAGGNFVQFSSGTINGNFDFVGTAQTNLGSGTLHGSITGNVSNVSTAYNAFSTLSTLFAGENGSAKSFSNAGPGTLTLTATNGFLDPGGDYVFTTTASDFLANGPLTISGTASEKVVINVTGNNNVQLKNLLSLSGGITDDNVFINITGTGQSVGGNTNGGIINGNIVALNDKFNVDNTTIDGRVVGGSNQNFMLVSGLNVNSPPPNVPEPASLAVLGLGALLLRRRRF